jgi:hypothetical protein
MIGGFSFCDLLFLGAPQFGEIFEGPYFEQSYELFLDTYRKYFSSRFIQFSQIDSFFFHSHSFVLHLIGQSIYIQEKFLVLNLFQNFFTTHIY